MRKVLNKLVAAFSIAQPRRSSLLHDQPVHG